MAAIPDPHTVMGLALQPFSAGHVMLLNRLENSFINGGVCGMNDLLTGIWICSRSYQYGLECLHRADELSKVMAKWVATYVKANGPINFDLLSKRFKAYLEAGQTEPFFRTIRSGENQRTMTVILPMVQIIKLELMKSGVVQSEAEFLSRPWGLSIWDYFSIKALRCEGEILEKSEEDTEREMVEMSKAINKKILSREKRAKKKGKK